VCVCAVECIFSAGVTGHTHAENTRIYRGGELLKLTTLLFLTAQIGEKNNKHLYFNFSFHFFAFF